MAAVIEHKIAVCSLCGEKIDLSRPVKSGPTHRLVDHRSKAHPDKHGRIVYRILRTLEGSKKAVPGDDPAA